MHFTCCGLLLLHNFFVKNLPPSRKQEMRSPSPPSALVPEKKVYTDGTEKTFFWIADSAGVRHGTSLCTRSASAHAFSLPVDYPTPSNCTGWLAR